MYTLKGTVLIQSSWNFVWILIIIISRSSLKLGHVREKTRLLGQILKKPSVTSRGHSFDLKFMNLCQKINHCNILIKFWIWSGWVKNRLLGQILEKSCVHSRRHSFNPSSRNCVRMSIIIISKSSLKLGHVGSKTRSLGQKLEKPCVPCRKRCDFYMSVHHYNCIKSISQVETTLFWTKIIYFIKMWKKSRSSIKNKWKLCPLQNGITSYHKHYRIEQNSKRAGLSPQYGNLQTFLAPLSQRLRGSL